MKMNEFPSAERPRERLLEKGPAALSDSELLAVLLRTGTTQKNVLDLARDLMLESGGSLSVLSDMSTERLTRIPGIGKDKAATVSAAFELGRRFISQQDNFDHTSITEPGMIYGLMRPQMKGLTHEECWAIYLNRANYVIGRERVSSGGLTSTTMDIKAIVKKAMEKNATGVVIAHNHPSGNPHPGNADVQQTKVLRKALNSMDISLVDHIVVCDNSFFSFNTEKVYNPPADEEAR